MKLLFNPIIIRMVLGALIAAASLLFAVIAIRLIRKSISDEADTTGMRSNARNSELDLTLAAYQGVIQQYKTAEQEKEKQRQAERQRANTSANLSDAVLSNLSSGVLLFNTVGLVQQANAAAKSILGYGALSGMRARDILRDATSGTDGSPVPAYESVEAALRERRSLPRLEFSYATPAGERRVLALTLSPVTDTFGSPLGTACLINDLTELTQLTQQVRIQDNMASLGEMSAGIAHEFKNSLATISGYAQMIGDEKDAATARAFGGKIAQETGNLTRIVTDFLNFARPQGISREPVELRPMLESCAQECEARTDLSEVATGIVLMGDATALRQVFSNLLRNSAEAARKDSTASIVIKAIADQGRAEITIRDNGTGIPPAQQSKVFIPFFTTKTAGTGLGLALVHRIVTDHGGSISLTSNENGTTFVIALPLYSAANDLAATN